MESLGKQLETLQLSMHEREEASSSKINGLKKEVSLLLVYTQVFLKDREGALSTQSIEMRNNLMIIVIDETSW